MFGFIKIFLTGLTVLSSLVSTTTLSRKNVIFNIVVYFVYYKCMNRNKENVSKYDHNYQAKNWCWNGIKNKIKEVSSGECDYEKDYMKIKFNSDDDLPLNKPLKFHSMTITIRSVFEEDGKLYPQVFLDDTLYELNV